MMTRYVYARSSTRHPTTSQITSDVASQLLTDQSTTHVQKSRSGQDVRGKPCAIHRLNTEAHKHAISSSGGSSSNSEWGPAKRATTTALELRGSQWSVAGAKSRSGAQHSRDEPKQAQADDTMWRQTISRRSADDAAVATDVQEEAGASRVRLEVAAWDVGQQQ